MAKQDLPEWQIEDLRGREVFDSESHGKLAMTALHKLDMLGDTLRKLGLPILALQGIDDAGLNKLSVSMDLLDKLGASMDLLNKLGVSMDLLDNVKLSASIDLLNKLGVRVYPSLAVINEWLASPDNTTVRKLAVQCLTENRAGYHKEAKKPGVALIPTKSGKLAHPNEVDLANPVPRKSLRC